MAHSNKYSRENVVRRYRDTPGLCPVPHIAEYVTVEYICVYVCVNIHPVEIIGSVNRLSNPFNHLKYSRNYGTMRRYRKESKRLNKVHQSNTKDQTWFMKELNISIETTTQYTRPLWRHKYTYYVVISLYARMQIFIG